MNNQSNSKDNNCKDFSEKRTPMQLFFLSNGFRLNPYDEIDEDFLREMND